MLFNSFEYLIFLPCVLAAYWALQGRVGMQNALLLIASYFFYGWWDPRFLFLIAITTVVDFNIALLIDRGQTTQRQRLLSIGFIVAIFLLCVIPNGHVFGEISLYAGTATAIVAALIQLAPRILATISESIRRKTLIAFSIAVNLGILGFFKYFGFFSETFTDIYSTVFNSAPSALTLAIILPVGISFYTFQSMSYSIDVYRRQLKATSSLVEFGAYLSFFPQLVAGPIERGKNLLPQFQQRRTLTKEGAYEGLWLIAWGLFKKVVIADNLAVIVNSTFHAYDIAGGTNLPEPGGLVTLIAVYAFAFQIYADFSGYSDIARGTAKLLGFELMLNFKIPYISKTPSEFWERWHISLSSWLRDYLYIPLGGNRGGSFGTYRNLSLTMILGGLWHGASWNFVLWGAYQGLILVLYRIFQRPHKEQAENWAWSALNIAWFFQLTCIGWLIFRARNLDTITTFFKSIFLDFRFTQQALESAETLLFYVAPLVLVQIAQIAQANMHFLPALPKVARAHIWFLVIISILALGSRREADFIYFAF